MRVIPYLVLLVAALPNLVHAGQGTISETDSQIIVEYQGNANDVAAATIEKAKEDKLKAEEERMNAKEAERIRILTENHLKQAEKRRAKYNDGSED